MFEATSEMFHATICPIAEVKIVSDMRSIQAAIVGDVGNKRFYLSSLGALGEQLVLLNKAVPDLLKEWSPIKGVEKEVKKETVRMSYVSPATSEKRYVAINKKDKKA